MTKQLTDQDFTHLTGLHPSHVLEQLPDALFILRSAADDEFELVYHNPVAARAAARLREGCSGPDAEATRHQDLQATTDGAAPSAELPAQDLADYFVQQTRRCAVLRQPVRFTVRAFGSIGESVLCPVLDREGRVTHVIGIVRDVTDQYRREQRLERLAYYDSLTGLLNRQAGRDRLRQLRNEAKDRGLCMVILMLDSDNLKTINDTHGHAIGDKYLRELAQRLRTAIRTGDLVTRIGGDEFLVAALIESAQEGEAIAERLLERLRTPWSSNGLCITPSVSIGGAIYPVHGTTLTDLIQTADKAMYRAKLAGGNRCHIPPVAGQPTQA